MSLERAVEHAIEEATGASARIVSTQGVGGGCISHAQVITLDDGRVFFLKSNPDPLPDMFPREAEGLEEMHVVGAIRVPKPICTGGEGAAPFIVMEHIATGRPGRDFQATMGRQLAQLHQRSQGDRFGFDHDNYIGSTPQPNDWCDDWVTFWREHRLGFQLRLARKQGLSDPTMDRLGDVMMNRLDDLIGEPNEPACVLHGDLWSGNYLCDDQGEPVLIDPAVYCGRREADLAMTTLFGGFDRDFYAAYEEVWPLAEGSAERLEIYKLYHLLNHLNLFGHGYHGGCMAILKKFA